MKSKHVANITVVIIPDNKPVADDNWDYDIKKDEIIQPDWEYRMNEYSNIWYTVKLTVGKPLRIDTDQAKVWRRPRITVPPQKDVEWLDVLEKYKEQIHELWFNHTKYAKTFGKHLEDEIERLHAKKKDKV